MPTVLYDQRWNGPFGIGRYSREVRERLSDDVHDVTAPGAPLKPRGMLAWENAVLRARRRLPRGTVLLSPGFAPSVSWSGPGAITVHDLIHLDVPEESSRAKRLFYEGVIKPAVRRHEVTFTVSEFSKRRLLEWSGVAEDRIVVTGNAADGRFTPDGPAHKPGYEYVLAIRNAKPHKNTPRLIEAFSLLPHPQLRLVLSGPRDDDARAAAERCGVGERVVFTGHVPDVELPALYRGAAAVAFPSLYEGFGIPAIEGMACGTPVVAANTTSVPEIVGAAALLVDPRDIESISTGLERALTDEALRGHLRTAGLNRAAEFSWGTVAERVHDALAKLGG